MTRVRRTDAEVEGTREAARIAATLGAELKRARKRRRLTQRALGARVGLGQGRISELERGLGAAAPLETWVALGLAVGQPLAVAFSRDIEPNGPRDAGHLAAQELILELARRHGRRAEFELPTRASGTSSVIDVLFRDDVARVLVVNEIWNRLDDFGAAVRSTSRKVVEAEGLAVLAGGEGPEYRIASCWLLVDTAANRRMLARYPEIVRSKFPGSSIAWVNCLVHGAAPPVQQGVTWIDTRSARISPVRLRRPAKPDAT